MRGVARSLGRRGEQCTAAGPRHARDPQLDDGATSELLARYVHAWERADVDELVALLHADATLTMPPLSQWLRGPEAIAASIAAMVFGPAGPDVFRLVPVGANGLPAFAAYRRAADGTFEASALHVLELDASDRIAGIVAFQDPRLFAAFALPARLPC